MEIIISNHAKNTITDIFYYSKNISYNYAKRVVNEIYDNIYTLQYAPYIGRYVPELSDKHYRERICHNYRIIYFISEENNTIFIRYIISCKQNSKLFFNVHRKELFNFLNLFFN